MCLLFLSPCLLSLAQCPLPPPQHPRAVAGGALWRVAALPVSVAVLGGLNALRPATGAVALGRGGGWCARVWRSAAQFDDFKVLEVVAVDGEAHERARCLPTLQAGCSGIDVEQAERAVVLNL